MYACMHIHTCICIYIYVYTFTHMYIYVHTCIHIQSFVIYTFECISWAPGKVRSACALSCTLRIVSAPQALGTQWRILAG